MGNSSVLDRLVVAVGFDLEKGTQSKLQRNLNQIKNTLQGVAAASATVFGVRRLIDFTNQVAVTGDQIAKTASQFAMSGEEFQKFSFAAERTGVQVAQVGAFFRQITRRAGEADKGNKTFAKTFRDLGITSLREGGKLKTTSQLFLEIADGIKSTQDQGERLRLLQAVGDEMGPAMVNLLQGGREEIEKYGKALDRIGVVSDENLKEFEDFRDSVSDLKRAFFSIAALMAAQVTPLLRKLGDVLLEVKAAIPDETFAALGRVLVTLTAAIAAVATVIVMKMIPALLTLAAPFLPLIAVILAVALALEDLWVMFRGGDSVIGRFIDSVFGEGSATVAVELFKDAIDMLVKAFNFMKPAIKAVGSYILDFFLAPIKGAIQAVKLMGKAAKFTGLTKLKNIMFDTKGEHEPLFGKQNMGSVADAMKSARTGTIPGKGSSSSTTSNQNAQVNIKVDASSAASPQQIGKAVGEGARAGVNRGFQELRDSQLVGAQ